MRSERQAALWALALMAATGTLSAAEQTDTCYRTEAGRIVKRRVPELADTLLTVLAKADTDHPVAKAVGAEFAAVGHMGGMRA